MEYVTSSGIREHSEVEEDRDLNQFQFPLTLLPLGNLTDNTTSNDTTLQSSSREVLPFGPITLTKGQENILYWLGVFSLVICVTGIVCNSLSMVILARREMRSTTSTFLNALSVADMVVLITVTLLCSLGSMINWNIGVLVDVPLLPYIYPFLRPAALTAIFTSIWLTVALTVDRYLAVCHALHTDRLFTISRARAVTAAIICLCVIYNIPTYFEYSVVRHVNEARNMSEVLYVLTDFGANPIYRRVYHSWLLAPFVWGIPFMSLAYMNTRLSLAVHQSRRRSKELGYPLTRGLDTTAMLVAVVLTFLLFQSPHLVATLIWSIEPTLYQNVSYLFFYYVAVILLLVNSSTNFFVYTVFSRRFRRQLLQVLCSAPCISREYRARYKMRNRANSYYDTSQIEYRKKSSISAINNRCNTDSQSNRHQNPKHMIDSEKFPETMALFSRCSTEEGNTGGPTKNTPLMTDSV